MPVTLQTGSRTPRVRLTQQDAAQALARQCVAWYDELAMLQVVLMGDLQHETGSADADAIETLVAMSGGNVSRYLMPEERTLPNGSHPAIVGLQVSFTVELSDSCLLYTSPSPRDGLLSRMPSSA